MTQTISLIENKAADLDTRVARIEKKFAGDSYAPTFENSWVNFGSPYQTARYYRDASDLIRLEGLIKSGSPSVAMFTLPVGFRPANTQVFLCAASGGSVRIDVLNTGAVQTSAYYGGATNAYVSLAGICFRVD